MLWSEWFLVFHRPQYISGCFQIGDRAETSVPQSHYITQIRLNRYLRMLIVSEGEYRQDGTCSLLSLLQRQTDHPIFLYFSSIHTLALFAKSSFRRPREKSSRKRLNGSHARLALQHCWAKHTQRQASLYLESGRCVHVQRGEMRYEGSREIEVENRLQRRG